MSSEEYTVKPFEISPAQKKNDPSGLWYGLLYKNRPAPSGMPRLRLDKEMNIGRKTPEEAVLDVVHIFICEGDITLEETAIHSRFLAVVEEYIKNPDPNRFNQAS